MLRVVLVCLAFTSARAIVCPANYCDKVECKAISADECLGGKVKPHASFCGCCDHCVYQLAEGQSCFAMLLRGVPPSSECGEGLHCDRDSVTCKPTIAKRTSKTCAEKLDEIKSSGVTLLGQFIPVCEADGSYAAKQCHGSVCYCVTSEGERIQDYSAPIGESANMTCKCALDQHAYRQTGLIGRMYDCTTSGNYEKYACTGSVCYCVDTLGAAKEGSPTVNIGQLDKLQC